MLWQKASARTVAVIIPVRRPRSQLQLSWSVRMVVAPSRRLQYAAKSCSPSSRCGGRVHRVHVQRPVVPQHMAAQQRIDPARVVGHPVGVAAPDRGEARVEPGRAPRRPRQTRTSCGSRPASRRSSLSWCSAHTASGRSTWATWPAGVHPGVGPPRDGQLDRSRRAAVTVRRALLQLALHGAPLALLRPAGEVLAVVARSSRTRTKPGAASSLTRQILSERRSQTERARTADLGAGPCPGVRRAVGTLRRPWTPRPEPRRPRPRRPRPS